MSQSKYGAYVLTLVFYQLGRDVEAETSKLGEMLVCKENQEDTGLLMNANSTLA